MLCVGRHAFLSEHLCRVFGEAGAHCEPVTGAAAAARAAEHFEPAVIVADGDLLTPAVLESWSTARALRDVPLIAVTLTPRPDDMLPADTAAGGAAAIYLPSLDRVQIASLLASVHRPCGVSAPPEWRVRSESTSAHQR